MWHTLTVDYIDSFSAFLELVEYARCARVCRDWRRVLRTARARRAFAVNACVPHDSWLAPHIGKLHTRRGWPDVRHLARLQHLVCSSIASCIDTFGALPPSLHTVHLYMRQFEVDAVTRSLRALSTLPNLTALELSYKLYRYRMDDVFPLLAPCLPRLQRLRLKGFVLKHCVAVEPIGITDALARATRMTHLDVRLPPGVFVKLAHLPLKHIRLCTGYGMRTLVDATALPTLTSLRCEDTGSMSAISPPRLRHLDLRYVHEPLGSVHVAHLSACAHLETLHLAFQELSRADARHIVCALKHLRRLSLDAEGSLTPLDFLPPDLETLTIAYMAIEPADVARLRGMRALRSLTLYLAVRLDRATLRTMEPSNRAHFDRTAWPALRSLQYESEVLPLLELAD
jgi:hypothetical protein